MESLGDFAIEGVLGQGGSAIVYAARRGEEEIALKVVRPEAELSEREQRAFVAEAHRAQRVAHPSLIAILDAGTLPDGRPYIAMPRLAGESLADRIARGPMLLGVAMRLFEGLAGAVQALHEAGLIHRDIKPENVFVVGAEERLVLLDLGIARDIEAPASTTTQAGLVRGTPAYMAPERFFGTRASVASDIYEITVVLYAMLTGGLPWDNGQGARGRMSPRDPREIVPVSSAVAKVLLRALSVDEAERPATVKALVEELESAAAAKGDEDLVATGVAPITPPPQADSHARMAVLPAPDLATQQTVAVSNAQAGGRGRAWVAPALAAGVLAAAAAGAWAFLVRPDVQPSDDPAASAAGDATTSAEPAASGEAEPTASADPTASASGARAAQAGHGHASPSASLGTPQPELAACEALPGIYCAPEYTKHDTLPCAQWTTRVRIYRSQDRSRWASLNAECRVERAAAQARLTEWTRQAAQKKKP